MAKLRPEDFRVLHNLGEGSYSSVYCVQRISNSDTIADDNGALYALKVLNKDFLARRGAHRFALHEKQALLRCDHPNIIKLYHTFQDTENLYFVLELAERGDVRSELAQFGRLTVELARFYCAQLVSALFYLHHEAKVVHRDVKPDNLLLNANRHIKLGDFGTSKCLDSETETVSSGTSAGESGNGSNARARPKRSFVGTAFYVAPELLADDRDSEGEGVAGGGSESAVGIGVDWWAAGCCLYEMLTGTAPFTGASEFLIFQAILHETLMFPVDFDEHARDLIEKLMAREPRDRLGMEREDWAVIRAHPFFAAIDFDMINTCEAQAPPPPIDADGAERTKRYSSVAEDSLVGFQRSKAAQPMEVETDMPVTVSVTSADGTTIEPIPLPALPSTERALKTSYIVRHSPRDMLPALLCCSGCYRPEQAMDTETGILAFTDQRRLVFADTDGARVIDSMLLTRSAHVSIIDDHSMDIRTGKILWHCEIITSDNAAAHTAREWQRVTAEAAVED